MTLVRGLVVPLSQPQRVARMRYLAGLVSSSELDPYVRMDADTLRAYGYPMPMPGRGFACQVLYYNLDDHNGGTDPTAPDPATRWRNPGGTTTFRTCDCMGAMAWAGGFDRYQPKRFAHSPYAGWINTNSMRIDAGSRSGSCFIRLERPERGCFVAYASGAGGHKVGHIGGIVGVPAEWDASKRECWEALVVVDVAARGAGVRANKVTTGRGWFGCDAWFMRSVMQP